MASRGYQIEILGDEFSTYPAWHGPATVINFRAAVRRMVQDAHDPNDHVAVVVSSHGSGDQCGDSYICLLPDPDVGTTEDERTGVYHATEIAADLALNGRNVAQNFIFLDLCLSGGIIHELTQALPYVIGTTTSTRSGLGYDSYEAHSGAWTHYFLHRRLLASDAPIDPDLVQVFREAHREHTAQFRRTSDRPCFFARTPDGGVLDTEVNASLILPVNTYLVSDWL
jgi:hypothetical protein